MRSVDGWWVTDSATWNPEVRAVKTAQVEFVMPFVHGRRLAISAGAWNGLFPAELARHFERVLAFEPDPANHLCAQRNLEPFRTRVQLRHAMLTERSGVGELAPAADGLHYVAGAEREAITVPALAIDDLELDRCDLILLDVEGYEHKVLQGAERTLERCRPTLMLEENELCFRYGRGRGDVRRWLESRGYRYIGEWTTLPPEIQNDGFRGSDLIFVPEYCVPSEAR